MPIYPCKCDKCGRETEVFLPVSKHKDLPECCGKRMTRIYTPLHVIDDTKGYKSPLDGTWVEGKKAHRQHMRKHGVIEVGNEKLTRPATKKVDDKKHSDDLKKDIAKTLSGYGI